MQIDAKLLALFVEMASFEPQRFCHLGDLAAISFEFGEHGGALEGLHPFRERARRGAAGGGY